MLNSTLATPLIQFQNKYIPNGLEKYMSFNVNNKLIFIYSFQYSISSLDTTFFFLNNTFLTLATKIV